MWTDQSVSIERVIHACKISLIKKSKRCCSDEEVLARKEEILRTATELFAEHGFSDAITQVLADRLQLGKGTIYRHFPSKRDLFLAAADRVMRKMQEKILANIAGVEDGLEQVSRGIMAFLSFFAEHPEYVELLIQERAQFKDRKRPTYFEHREVNVVRWRKLYARLIAEGRVRDLPVEQITNVMGNLDLRHDVHQLLHRAGETGGGAGEGDPRHRLPGNPHRSGTGADGRRRSGKCHSSSRGRNIDERSRSLNHWRLGHLWTAACVQRFLLLAGMAGVAGCGQASSQTGPAADANYRGRL